ncbi:MAG: ABC transporter substrate-binding protein [Alkalinema sp. RU_4_3]|nr:ABC transporter substrate-binding protein [Alkalinema sp. RU_4_3]
MSVFVEIDHVDKVFPLANGGKYIALKGIELKLKEGEFVSLIGHSGCGKSTLLNIVAGFDRATSGGVVLEGREIESPGPDRMMVFQNYSLLPWLTVRQNIALAVNRVMKDLPYEERSALIDKNIELVGLTQAADKKPGQLSGGMKQRTAIARALAIRPKMLLLDEPFGALDALTRGNLQEQLMQICQDTGMTCMMVTHDVDEALLLSDRVVMLTNGPEAHIGQILEVDIPRPRRRMEVVKNDRYYDLRNQMIYFLNQQKRDKRRKAAKTPAVAASRPVIPAAVAVRTVEKKTVTLGFVGTTDAAPLMVAQQQGLFKKYGLEDVVLQREHSWQAVADRLVGGQLDAAQLLAGMPLAITLGASGHTQDHVVTSMVLSRNGNAITLSNRFKEMGVTSLAGLKEQIQGTPDRPHVFGVVDEASMGALLLRYWLASGGLDPERDLSFKVMNSSSMPSRLQAGEVEGYLAAEPWNMAAVKAGTGFVAATDLEIWNGHQNKVLGVTNRWAEANPEIHQAILKALIEACEYCDDPRNRDAVVQLVSSYLECDPEQIKPGFSAAYDRGLGQGPEQLVRFNRFYSDQSTCPRRQEALWILTQLARWGITAFPKNWVEVLDRTYRLDWYGEAARALGIPDAEPDRMPVRLFDGLVFNPDDPLKHLDGMAIRQAKIAVAEVDLDALGVPMTGLKVVA